MNDNLSNLSKKAAKLILSMPKSARFRVVSHYDADGITSASIICMALKREGYDFHVSLMRNPFTKGLERIKNEDNEFIIFTDMGSGQIETIENLDIKNIIIVDHHQILKTKVKKNIIQINANLCGINGNYEASGSSLSYSLAKAINDNNGDLSSLAMAGITGDKQYIGGISGYNKDILEDSVKRGYLKKFIGIKLYGNTLFDALYYSIDPYYSGITGNKEAIENLLKVFNISKNIKFDHLNNVQKRKINSYLILKLLKKGCEKNIIDTVIRERYWSEKLGCELERFSDLLDTCGKGGNRSIGLALCFGDKEFFNRAIEFEKSYKEKIINELLRLELKGFLEKDTFYYFYSEESSLGGVIAGIASNYILDRNKPLFSLIKKDDEIHISCRGNQYLVSKGLDLGSAMREIANSLNGHGGGHKIAAGATISIDNEDEFINKVNMILKKQFKV